MPIELLLRGILVGVSLGAPIGPVNVEIARRGLRGGFRSGWLVDVGATTADAIYCMAVIAGLSPLIDQLLVRTILWTLGTCFLVFLSWSSIRTILRLGRMIIEDDSLFKRSSFVTGFFIAALNPMGIFFWLSVGGGFVASGVERAADAACIASIVVGVIAGLLIWITTLSIIVHSSRRLISDGVYCWINFGSGLILIGFAAWFAVQAIEGIVELAAR